MAHTEEEARAKWCPYVRHEGDDGGTFNRGAIEAINVSQAQGYFRYSCIGPSCMMWRWALVDNPDYKHPNWSMPPPDHRNNPVYITSKTHGCCGLAGRE